MCAAHLNNFSSNLVERVDFSDSRVALLWAGLQVFPNKYHRVKVFVCPVSKYHKSWSNSAAELHNSVDLLCDTTAAELHNSVDLLCDTTAAELHNSVDLLCDTTAAELHKSVNLLCGTTAAELNPVWCMHQESQIFRRQWRTMLKNMKASSKVKFNSKLLKDERFGRFSKHRSMYALRRFRKLFKRWTLYGSFTKTISDLSKPLWKMNAADTRIKS